MKRYLFDIETDGLLDKCSAIHSLVIKDVDTGEKWSCHDQAHREVCSIAFGLGLLEGADVLIGHNILTFDIPAIKKIWPAFNPRATSPGIDIIDTLIMVRLLWPEIEAEDYVKIKKGETFPPNMAGSHSLKAWGYRIGVLKGTYGETTDWSQWTPEMQAYCEQDIEVNHALLTKIEKENTDPRAVLVEHEFAQYIFIQETCGVKVDKVVLGKLVEELTNEKQKVNDQLQEIFEPTIITMKTPAYYRATTEFGDEIHRAETKTKLMADLRSMGIKPTKNSVFESGPLKRKSIPFNPGSRLQIAERLKLLGWVPTQFTPSGDATIDEDVLKNIALPEAKILNEYLFFAKMLGQVHTGDKSWSHFLTAEGRIHGRVMTLGAVTRRCTHSKPNLSQVKSVEKGKDKKILLGRAGDFGWECRSCFIADDGYDLVGWDAAGLELRTLSHYMTPYDGGAYGRVLLEGDIHEANRIAAGLATRDAAKTYIYAQNYGAGDFKLGSIEPPTPEEIEHYRTKMPARWNKTRQMHHRRKMPTTPLAIATTIKGAGLRARFAAKMPAMADLLKEIETRVEMDGFLPAIDGSRLHIRSKHSALNTLLQSCGAILVKKATVIHFQKCLDMGWRCGRGLEFHPALHVHDESQANVRPELSDEFGTLAIASIKESGCIHSLKIGLDGEYKKGKSWADTH